MGVCYVLNAVAHSGIGSQILLILMHDRPEPQRRRSGAGGNALGLVRPSLPSWLHIPSLGEPLGWWHRSL